MGGSFQQCYIDSEVLKHRERMGFVTPIVYALTDGD